MMMIDNVPGVDFDGPKLLESSPDLCQFVPVCKCEGTVLHFDTLGGEAQVATAHQQIHCLFTQKRYLVSYIKELLHTLVFQTLLLM